MFENKVSYLLWDMLPLDVTSGCNLVFRRLWYRYASIEKAVRIRENVILRRMLTRQVPTAIKRQWDSGDA